MLTEKQVPYTGPYYGPADIRGPSKGPTAKALKRAMSRLGYMPWSTKFDEHYNLALQDAEAYWQSEVAIAPAHGQYGMESWKKLRDEKVTFGAHKGEYALDAIACKLIRDEAKKPVPKTLIEPNEGFDSLVTDLWEPFSMGRRLGLIDLGTWNPDSLLPSGAPSDHATSRLDGKIERPVCAFDLGISPHNGYSNPIGRLFFDQMKGADHIHYVILGNKIWSTDKGLHSYTDGGHENHCHVSGFRR